MLAQASTHSYQPVTTCCFSHNDWYWSSSAFDFSIWSLSKRYALDEKMCFTSFKVFCQTAFPLKRQRIRRTGNMLGESTNDKRKDNYKTHWYFNITNQSFEALTWSSANLFKTCILSSCNFLSSTSLFDAESCSKDSNQHIWFVSFNTSIRIYSY